MQTKLTDGSVMVCGTCGKDAEFKTVGEKKSRKCTVSLAVGKWQAFVEDKPVTIWCNVVAWHDLASLLAPARKGDAVFVIGRIKTREYNGKTYTDLEAEFLSVASVHAAMTFPERATQVQGPTQGDLFQEVDDPESDLPF